MDKHLNIFKFFNNNNTDLYEDNLSRAFAICLKYDTVFLDNILKIILNKNNAYQDLFGTEYPDDSIKIDLQKRPSDLGAYSKIIAIACSGSNVDFSNIDQFNNRPTNEPETDVCIEVNDTCLIFEFKRTSENCVSQLKSQAEKLSENSDNAVIEYIDLNWKKIVRVILNVLSLQKQINSENIFTNDFLGFLENSHPEWFPHKPFKRIPFSTDDAGDRNYFYLNARLNEIKNSLANTLGGTANQLKGSNSRLAVSVTWGWANEIIIMPEIDDGKEYLSLSIYIGDTKSQGLSVFKENKKAIEWPKEISGFPLAVHPYLKFSHYNSGKFWYNPNSDEYKKTHTYDFFKTYSGRYKKEKWDDFERNIVHILPSWKLDEQFYKHFINTNRTYFDLSVGAELKVNIPYQEIRNLDGSVEDSDSVVELLSKITNNLKSIIDQNTAG